MSRESLSYPSDEAPSASAMTSRIRPVTPMWRAKKAKAVENLREQRQNDPIATAHLIVPAAQHPLRAGMFPGQEFHDRLQASLDLYNHTTQEQGQPAKFFVTGSRHHDKVSGQTDDIALYDVAGRWLFDRGVPASHIHGKDWMVGEDEEIYNGADEMRVAARGFARTREFVNATYFCSPGQVSRAKMYALAHEFPVQVVVPEALYDNSNDQFHGGFQHFALRAVTNTIDPYGALLAKRSQDRIPADGNTGTITELIGNYDYLQWYQNQNPASPSA